MGRENRRDRRSRVRQQRRQGAEPPPLQQVEFPGIMGWMQRNSRWLFLIGIMFMILSVGAGAFAAGIGTPEPETPTPTATAESAEDPEATPTEEVVNRQYSAAPEMALDQGVDYRAVIRLENGGEVHLDLLEDDAPEYVNNFVFLARNRFYDGLTFHRVIPGFVAQAGDPLGSGSGGPGYFLAPETNEAQFERGALSMAQSSLGVSGSQFFVTLGPTPHLNADFTVFGWVTRGMSALDGLTPRDPQAPGQPRGDVIAGIEIIEEPKPEGASDADDTADEDTAEEDADGDEATATPTGTPGQ